MSQQLFDILQVMIRHMRDAEGLVFQLAVAIGDLESPLTQLMVEISHIDIAGIGSRQGVGR